MAPAALPAFLATADPPATVSSSTAFPGVAGYTAYLAPTLSAGTRTVSPVARPALCHRAVPTTPPKCPAASVRLPPAMLPSSRMKGLGLRIEFFSRPLVGSLPLRPGDSLTIPKMAWSVGFLQFVSSPEATQAAGVLTVPPVGLAPTEQASLCWTHSSARTPSLLLVPLTQWNPIAPLSVCPPETSRAPRQYRQFCYEENTGCDGPPTPR